MIRALENQVRRGATACWLSTAMLIVACLCPIGCDRNEAQPDPQRTFERKRFEEGLLSIETWLAKGKPAEAEVVARRLVELDPQSVEALESHGRCLVVLAAVRRSEGSNDETQRLHALASERYQAAVLHSGDSPRPSLLHEAGIATTAAGEYERALSFHSRAAELESTNATHAIFTGNLLTRMKRPTEATPWFQQATQINPNEPWGWAGLAETRRQEKDYPAALEAIRGARDCAPANTNFRVAEARILRESSRGREAAMLLFAVEPKERATRLVTEELAAACTQIGDHQRAAEAWEAVHTHNPEDLDAMTEAALAWVHAGNNERAASWLNAAEEAGAAPDQVQRVRDQLAP